MTLKDVQYVERMVVDARANLGNALRALREAKKELLIKAGWTMHLAAMPQRGQFLETFTRPAHRMNDHYLLEAAYCKQVASMRRKAKRKSK